MRLTASLHGALLTGLAGFGLALVTGGLCQRAVGAEVAAPASSAEAPKTDYSPYPDQSFPNRVYWGVAHIHTGYSFDAGMFGITLTPDDLFKAARGGEVVGQRPAFQARPAAGLARDHRPCRVHGRRR